MKRNLYVNIGMGVLGLWLGCVAAYAGAQTEERAEKSLQPKVFPSILWVADFDLDYSDIHKDGGLVNKVTGRLGVAGRPGRRGQDPKSKAAKLSGMITAALVQELNNRSLPARPLPRGQALPEKGWLVQGQFTEVDEGNRVRRAVIGFGSGATHMQVEATVTDLSIHRDTPFLVLGTQAGSGQMPGAVVTMNPYVAAAKFVLAKNASEKDVSASARQIASEIANYVQTIGLRPGR